MNDVHVDSMISTSQESLFVLLVVDVPSDASQNESSWVDSLEVSPWHLQYNSRC